MNKQYKLLEKLANYAFTKTQYEILINLRNHSSRKRGLSEKQKELANSIYLQIKPKMISDEAATLIDNLSITIDSLKTAILDHYIYTSPLPSKDIQKVVLLSIQYCRNKDLKDLIEEFYISVYC